MAKSKQADGLVVRLTTTDSEVLVPALLRLGVWVRVTRDEVEIRGLPAHAVAQVAASRLAAVTDLSTVRA